MSAIAILWPVKAIFEKRAATVENYYKNTFQKELLWHNLFCKNYKTISLQTKISFACALANRDKPVAATLQKNVLVELIL